jgi:transcriptional regulator with XRE-family HTH domain
MIDKRIAKHIGETIRSLRKQSGLTLTNLAHQSDISQPYLSQIENGKAAPSIATLHKIAEVLGVTAQHLLESDENLEISLTRAKSAELHENTAGSLLRFLVRGNNHAMEPNEVIAQPGSTGGCNSHRGEEFVYVLEGKLRVKLKHQPAVNLGAGDAYCYPAVIPHEWFVIGSESARFLIISSPPSW